MPQPEAVPVYVGDTKVTQGLIVGGVTIGALRPVVEALGGKIALEGGEVRITPKAP